MKDVKQLKPNYAPVYCAAMYPELCKVFHKHGYALAVHGSLARDIDLIAIPWAEQVSDAETVLESVCKRYAVELIGGCGKKQHGRIAYTLSVGFGECCIDLSFMPTGKAGESVEPFINAVLKRRTRSVQCLNQNTESDGKAVGL